MTGRKQNNDNTHGNFGGTFKKTVMQNQSRNHSSCSRAGSFSGNLKNQVNPWLVQDNVSSFGDLCQNISADPLDQLTLASNLLNSLMGPSQQPSLLSLGGISNSPFSYSSFNKDCFEISGSNFGTIQKRDAFNTSLKNKRIGVRKNQKKDQIDKKVVDQKNAKKKEDIKKEGSKDDKRDINHSVRKSEKKQLIDSPVANDARNCESKKIAIEEPKISYGDIPPALLFCHICRKHMWDESSFEKHLEGRPHKMMVEELDRTYKLKVALLRHEARVMEQQREIDIKRAHRKGSLMKMQQRGSCTMCDLSFYGTLPAHRKSERHQRLKKFLHPKCITCNKEFYTRLEWDDHKLTATHLKKLAETREKRRSNLEEAEFDIIDFIDDINEELDSVLVDIKVCGKRENLEALRGECPSISQTENKEVDENEKDENWEMTKEEKVEAEKEDKYEEDGKIPKYVAGIPIGLNFVVEKSGVLCRACNRFILSSEDSRTHCQSLIHYNNTVRFLKIENKIMFGKRRLNDIKNEDGYKTSEVGNVCEAINANEINVSADENIIKRLKLEGITMPMIRVNDSVFGDTSGKKEQFPSQAKEECDPVNPSIELGKNHEYFINELMKPEQVLEDVKKEVIAEVLKAVQVSPEFLTKETRKVKPPSCGQRTRLARQS